MAYLSREVNQNLAKPPLEFSGGLAKLGLTSFVEYATDCRFLHDKWGLWCEKHVSQAGISNCISPYSVGCNYLSLSGMPASGAKVLQLHHKKLSLINPKPTSAFRRFTHPFALVTADITAIVQHKSWLTCVLSITISVVASVAEIPVF